MASSLFDELTKNGKQGESIGHLLT